MVSRVGIAITKSCRATDAGSETVFLHGSVLDIWLDMRTRACSTLDFCNRLLSHHFLRIHDK